MDGRGEGHGGTTAGEAARVDRLGPESFRSIDPLLALVYGEVHMALRFPEQHSLESRPLGRSARRAGTAYRRQMLDHFVHLGPEDLRMSSLPTPARVNAFDRALSTPRDLDPQG